MRSQISSPLIPNTPPITDSDLETLDATTRSSTRPRPTFYRRSETALATIRTLNPPRHIALFTPALDPPSRAKYASARNPFYAMGRRLHEYGYSVNHTNFSISSASTHYSNATSSSPRPPARSKAKARGAEEEPFTPAHKIHCATASAIIVVLCETSKAGVGTMDSQLEFADWVQSEVMGRKDGSGIDVPMVIARLRGRRRQQQQRKNGGGRGGKRKDSLDVEDGDEGDEADVEDDDGGGTEVRKCEEAVLRGGGDGRDDMAAAVENYDIEVLAGRYDELEMERVVDLLCRGR